MAGRELLVCVIPEIVLGKLTYGEWRNWPTEEQAAVERFLHAWWADFLAKDLGEDCDDGAGAADEVLCSIAQAVDDLGPYLEAWRDARAIAAWRHLMRFVLWWEDELLTGTAFAFWKEREGPTREVVQWLLEERTVEDLEWASVQCGRCADDSSFLLAAAVVRTARGGQ